MTKALVEALINFPSKFLFWPCLSPCLLCPLQGFQGSTQIWPDPAPIPVTWSRGQTAQPLQASAVHTCQPWLPPWPDPAFHILAPSFQTLPLRPGWHFPTTCQPTQTSQTHPARLTSSSTNSRGSPTLFWALTELCANARDGHWSLRRAACPIGLTQRARVSQALRMRLMWQTWSLMSQRLRPGPTTRAHLGWSPRFSFYTKYQSSFVNVDANTKENDFFGHDENF